MLGSILGAATTATTTATQTGEISLISLIICVVVALALGLCLALSFMYKNRYSTSFVLALAILPAVVCVVIMMVNGNVGAGVAVAGAFSLVRFRSAPGTGRDIAFVFLAMCIGLICGMGYLAIAALVTVVIGGTYLLLQQLGFGSSHAHTQMLQVVVPEDLEYNGLFDDLLDTYCVRHELVGVKTTNMGALYKMTWRINVSDNTYNQRFIDAIRERNGNLEVSLFEAPQDESVGL